MSSERSGSSADTPTGNAPPVESPDSPADSAEPDQPTTEAQEDQRADAPEDVAEHGERSEPATEEATEEGEFAESGDEGEDEDYEEDLPNRDSFSDIPDGPTEEVSYGDRRGRRSRPEEGEEVAWFLRNPRLVIALTAGAIIIAVVLLRLLLK